MKQKYVWMGLVWMFGISGMMACSGPPTPPVQNPPPAQFTVFEADGFKVVSNVMDHNKLPQDIGDIVDILAKEPTAYAKIKDLYVKGKNSVKSDGSVRTLNGFASVADNFTKYAPKAVAYFAGNGKFLDDALETGAIDGKGEFEKASDAARAAFLHKGLLALITYWLRLEFGKALELSEQKNFDAAKGAPHNWDEAFAYYWGPAGKHSLYQMASEISSKYQLTESINKVFFAQLIAGQKKLIEEKASPTANIDAAVKQLYRLFLLGLLDAANQIDLAGTDTAKKAVAQAAGRGCWYAVADIIAEADKEADAKIKAVFSGEPQADSAKIVKTALAKVIESLGMKTDDFGSALK